MAIVSPNKLKPLRLKKIKRHLRNSRITTVKPMCAVQKNPDNAQAVDPDFWSFAEKLNSRCAMQGFVWGSSRWITTQKSIIEQLVTKDSGHVHVNTDNILDAVLVVGLVALGTAITTIVNSNSQQSYYMFTQDAEITNGRYAMIGFVILGFISAFFY